MIQPTTPRARNSSGPRIAVVGAGIVGACLAYELTRRGADVVVLERDRPMAGATGKSFAWMTNQTFYRNADSLPESGARHYFGLHRLALGAWRRLDAEFGGTLGIKWTGAVQWADAGDEQEIERVREDLRRRQEWGSPSFEIDAEELGRLIPAAALRDVGFAFSTPDEATLDPLVATERILTAAVEAGAELRFPCEVVGFEGDGDRATAVVTSDGTIEVDAVVIAAGIDSPALGEMVGIGIRLIASTGLLLHLEPMDEFLSPVAMTPDMHVVQRRGGHVVVSRHFAGTILPTDETLEEEALLADAVELYPVLKDARISGVTSGSRVLPADGLPVIGRGAPFGNIHSVTTNAGVTLGAALAQLMTTTVLDGVQPDVLAPYAASRFA